MKLQRWDFYMGRKAKYTKKQKVQACEDYLKGRKTTNQIAVELNMSKQGTNIVLNLVKSFRANGNTIFDNKSANNKYSKEFKKMIVQEYQQGLGSSYDLVVKHGIPKNSTVLN